MGLFKKQRHTNPTKGGKLASYPKNRYDASHQKGALDRLKRLRLLAKTKKSLLEKLKSEPSEVGPSFFSFDIQSVTYCFDKRKKKKNEPTRWFDSLPSRWIPQRIIIRALDGERDVLLRELSIAEAIELIKFLEKDGE